VKVKRELAVMDPYPHLILRGQLEEEGEEEKRKGTEEKERGKDFAFLPSTHSLTFVSLLTVRKKKRRK